ncbi:MAG: hypothetical protein OER97_03965 [Gammaproteobacteria bacterium]|nr:hypothetical protein [Gammaproteobacteria bacterium]
MVLDTLVSVIDRLIKLKEYRHKGSESRFKDIYRPAFDEMLLVHRDYVSMLNRVLEMIQPTGSRRMSWETTQAVGNRTVAALKFLRQRRIEFEPVREKLGDLNGKLKTLDLQPIDTGFVCALEDYLWPVKVMESNQSLEIRAFRGSVLKRVVLKLELLERLFSPETESASILLPMFDVRNEYHWIDADYLAKRVAVQLVGFSGDVESSIWHLRTLWSRVCEAYVTLQVASSSHMGLPHYP